MTLFPLAKLGPALLAGAAALLLSTAAAAALHQYDGDTTGGPTFDRPLETLDFLPVPGQNSNYHALWFTVDTAGVYDFLSTAQGWDNFTLLYAPAFDPMMPLANALVANDDLGGVGSSGFSWALNTGVVYTFVTAGFAGGFDFGAFSNSIDGPGVVAVVPEPASAWLMLLGAAALLGLRRQRAAGTGRD